MQQTLVQQQSQMSPAKTPTTPQQIILKQAPQLVQKQTGVVVGSQVMPQQIVLSTNQIVTNQNGQQVIDFFNIRQCEYNNHFLVGDHQSNSVQ